KKALAERRENRDDQTANSQGPFPKRMAAARLSRCRGALPQGGTRPSIGQSNQVSGLDATHRGAADGHHPTRVVENPGMKVHRGFTRAADAVSDRARVPYRDQDRRRRCRQGRGGYDQGRAPWRGVKPRGTSVALPMAVAAMGREMSLSQNAF